MLKSNPESWRDPRHREGVRAERLAAELLRREGYEILEHRWRLHRHDVDLIARRGRTVVLVEVKSRADGSYGSPAEAVGRTKRLALARAAAAWLQRHGRPGDLVRFDVVAVQGVRLEWLRDAFRPGWR